MPEMAKEMVTVTVEHGPDREESEFTYYGAAISEAMDMAESEVQEEYGPRADIHTVSVTDRTP